MKARDGFVLRELLGEYMLMPVGDNIARFKGTVLLNELSAFVWKRLQVPVSRGKLLEDILNTYQVDSQTAAADLDRLLAELKDLGIVEG